MDTTEWLLKDLLKTEGLTGKDLIVHDDNGYYRGLITSSESELKVIKFILAETHVVRIDAVPARPVAALDLIDLPYFCIGYHTTYRAMDHEIIAMELSVSGSAYILPHNAPIPLFA